MFLFWNSVASEPSVLFKKIFVFVYSLHYLLKNLINPCVILRRGFVWKFDVMLGWKLLKISQTHLLILVQIAFISAKGYDNMSRRILLYVFDPVLGIDKKRIFIGYVVYNKCSRSVSVINSIDCFEPLTSCRIPKLYLNRLFCALDRDYLLHERGRHGDLWLAIKLALHVPLKQGRFTYAWSPD